MLCTPTICQVAVTRTLIDGGAGLSMLSVEAFNLLCIPLERLQPSRPFSGVGGDLQLGGPPLQLGLLGCTPHAVHPHHLPGGRHQNPH